MSIVKTFDTLSSLYKNYMLIIIKQFKVKQCLNLIS